MKEQPHTKQYTAEDLVRYHKGLMSAAEMNLLEREALEDPFLSDALDGYLIDNDANESLKTLYQKLGSIKKNEENSSNIKKYYSVLSIAATLLVLFFAGYFILHDDSKSTTLLAENNNPHQESQFNNKDTSRISITENSTAKKVIDTKYPLPVSPQSAPTETIETKSLVVNDKEKNSNSLAEDLNIVSTNVQATSAAPGAVATTAAVDDKFENISVSKDIAVQDKAVVDNISSKKKFSPAAAYSKSEELSTLYNSKKTTDVDDFNNFVENNKRICLDNKNNPIHGVVKLQFRIDNNGKATKIKVLNSINDCCDKEAIRLLNDFPQWKKITHKKNIVTITF
jgi:hypothetical protein